MIYPQTKDSPFRGDVLCENGRIRSLGTSLSDSDAETLDLTGLHLLPGLVDCHSHLGLGASGGISSKDFDSSAPVCPEIDVLYGATASAPGFRWAVENGITTLGILPGGANVVSGTGFAARTWGSSIFSMCLRRNMCLKMALGENTKGSFQSQGMEPDSRMGISFLMEEYFSNASAYLERKQRGLLVEYNERYELAIPALKGEIPVRVHCTHNDMASAIRCLTRYGIRFTIEHAWGTSHYLDEITDSGCTIVYGPIGGRKSFYESRFVDIDAVAELDRRGVRCCLTVDSPIQGPDSLLSTMEQAVREGTDPLRVLRMVTIHPAAVLGLEQELGSIEPGKYANFAVFRGLPGSDMGAHVVATVGEGTLLYRRMPPR